MVSFINFSLVFLPVSYNLKSYFMPNGYNKYRCINQVLTLRWFILSRLEYVSGEGSSREEAGKGRRYMTEPSVTEESSEEKLEDSKS